MWICKKCDVEVLASGVYDFLVCPNCWEDNEHLLSIHPELYTKPNPFKWVEIKKRNRPMVKKFKNKSLSELMEMFNKAMMARDNLKHLLDCEDIFGASIISDMGEYLEENKQYLEELSEEIDGRVKKGW